MKSDRITYRFIQYTMDVMYQNIIQDISIIHACLLYKIICGFLIIMINNIKIVTHVQQ